MRYQKKSLFALGALLASSTSCVYAEEASNMPDVPPIYFDWQKVFVEDEPEMKKLTESPSFAPTTSSPTKAPITSSPTKAPITMSPTKKPKNATARPTVSSSPSSKPTSSPSVTHSSKPTETKSAHPTSSPSLLPTAAPSTSPTGNPSYSPSEKPSRKPSSSPSHQPSSSVKPTNVPTTSPSYSPSFTPTASPTMLPSMSPTHKPSSIPTTSQAPSSSPTLKPSDKPSKSPSFSPSKSPSSTPSFSPTSFPSTSPTLVPSMSPTHKPSNIPTTSQAPSSSPTLKPSDKPSNSPSVSPTKSPSSTPSFSPTAIPSTTPTTSPSSSPTVSVSPTVTNVESMTSKVIIELDSFKSAMDDNEKETFENTAMKFIVDHIKVNHENVAVNVTSVEVVRQLRSKGSSNGFIQIQDVSKDERKRSLQSNNEGLLVELLVTADVSYGSLPEDFSLAKTISPGFQQNFVEFESELDDAFSVYNQIQGEGNGYGEDKTANGSTNLVVYISIACGVGGMVLATALLLVRRKRNALRIQEIRSQFTPSEDDSEFSEVDLSSPCEDVKVTQWDWRTNTAENIQKDLEGGNPYIIPNVYSTKSQAELSSLQYSIQSFDISSSENGTPTGSSTSSVSLGINVSPEAILEAKKQNQSFSFVPQETGVSQSFPDKSGRLVYKSYVVEAPQGPLGIIIDTTPEGPMVHAIKPTSQLLGSIAPGDIIVGLDSVDTRQMTAPTLTRLMASKSQQVERKITLLRPMSH